MEREPQKVNIKTISEATGFSPATVSNALNHKKGVKKETAHTVFETAKRLGYISDSRIKRIRFIVYRREGSIIVDNPFFNKVLSGVEAECSRSGFELMVNYLDMRLQSYREDLAGILGDSSSGLILMGSELEESEIRHFLHSGLPQVYIDYWNRDMDCECIVNNGYDSVRRAAEYLLEKGHTKIGYLQGELRIFPFREREQALRDTLRARGVPLEEAFVFPVALSLEDSYHSMREHLKRDPALPTAFFADNDVLALGAMRAMREAGLQLPGDVSVIGFDDVPMGELNTPRLTSIRTEMEELGREAARKILASAKDPGRPKSKLVYATRFVERDSVSAIG